MTTDTKFNTQDKIKTKKPKMYAVMLINDDYTTMEFVMYVLQQIFGKSEESAFQIMLSVHQKGKGEAGLYNFQVAEQKAYETKMLAKQNNYPLQVTLEEIS